MTNVVGIIGEYNPFHNGHAYHLEKSKQLLNANYVVAVVSGNFVQRGNVSLIDNDKSFFTIVTVDSFSVVSSYLR